MVRIILAIALIILLIISIILLIIFIRQGIRLKEERDFIYDFLELTIVEDDEDD